ncbi:coiled-coil domain-containing protein [Legionella spiritensis]|uniref:Uncharacterized protein n=1 Tax=Legionella spiritensis TaxID=452 RepID=A0A0W0YY06_LEGSP|nr:hypothetical protein [Legionella spiritensis]KTD61398.1 hypothetical protein Lspi_2640 [Legionella spiritensis]SNV33533.1 Uncharacterised protein [Legionella spiritensis]
MPEFKSLLLQSYFLQNPDDLAIFLPNAKDELPPLKGVDLSQFKSTIWTGAGAAAGAAIGVAVSTGIGALVTPPVGAASALVTIPGFAAAGGFASSRYGGWRAGKAVEARARLRAQTEVKEAGERANLRLTIMDMDNLMRQVEQLMDYYALLKRKPPVDASMLRKGLPAEYSDEAIRLMWNMMQYYQSHIDGDKPKADALQKQVLYAVEAYRNQRLSYHRKTHFTGAEINTYDASVIARQKNNNPPKAQELVYLSSVEIARTLLTISPDKLQSDTYKSDVMENVGKMDVEDNIRILIIENRSLLSALEEKNKQRSDLENAIHTAQRAASDERKLAELPKALAEIIMDMDFIEKEIERNEAEQFRLGHSNDDLKTLTKNVGELKRTKEVYSKLVEDLTTLKSNLKKKITGLEKDHASYDHLDKVFHEQKETLKITEEELQGIDGKIAILEKLYQFKRQDFVAATIESYTAKELEESGAILAKKKREVKQELISIEEGERGTRFFTRKNQAQRRLIDIENQLAKINHQLHKNSKLKKPAHKNRKKVELSVVKRASVREENFSRFKNYINSTSFSEHIYIKKLKELFADKEPKSTQNYTDLLLDMLDLTVENCQDLIENTPVGELMRVIVELDSFQLTFTDLMKKIQDNPELNALKDEDAHLSARTGSTK